MGRKGGRGEDGRKRGVGGVEGNVRGGVGGWGDVWRRRGGGGGGAGGGGGVKGERGGE